MEIAIERSNQIDDYNVVKFDIPLTVTLQLICLFYVEKSGITRILHHL